MLTISLTLAELQGFLLVFLRTGAFLLAIPFWNGAGLPVLFRVGFALAASLLLAARLGPGALPFAADVLRLGVAAAGEVMVGLLAGVAIRVIFEAVQLAGELAGYQMGLAIAEVLDPTTEDQVPLLGQFLSLVATLVFLATHGHHALIRTLTESFTILPPNGFHAEAATIDRLARLTAEVFGNGLRAAAPVVVALVLATVAFGVVARTVPQMNIFVVSLPLNIALGLVLLGLTLPHLVGYLAELFAGAPRHMLQLLR